MASLTTNQAVAAKGLRTLYAGAMCSLLGIITFVLWMRTPYISHPTPLPEGMAMYSGWQMFSLAAASLLAAPSVFLTLIGANHWMTATLALTVENCPAQRARRVMLLVMAVYGAIMLGLFVVPLVLLIMHGYDPLFRCGIIFCVGTSKYSSSLTGIRGEGIRATVAYMLCVWLWPLAAIMPYRLYSQFTRYKSLLLGREGGAAAASSHSNTGSSCGDDAGPPLPPQSVREAQEEMEVEAAGVPNIIAGDDDSCMVPMAPLPTGRRVALVAVFIVVILCFAIPSFYVDSNRKFTASGIARAAAKAASRTATSAEYPWAWFKTNNIKISDALYLKLFPGNIFFFVYLLVALVVGAVAAESPAVGSFFCRRWKAYPQWTYAELSLLGGTLLMAAFFFFYWVHDHNFKEALRYGATDTNVMYTSERWGRALGQLAVMLLSLLLLPTSRHSTLHRVMGTSVDGLLWFHRWMGYAMLAALVAHVVVFLWNFYSEGTLGHNLSYLPSVVGRRGVKSDFTIAPLYVLTGALLVAMGPLAWYPVRRACFELFYYSHIVCAYAILPVLLWHVGCGWQYMLPGVALWGADWIARQWQAAATVTVLRARLLGGGSVVDIAFTSSRLGRGSASPGHYVLVLAPQLSTLEWHPVTLCEADGAGAHRLLVQVTGGAGSWSSRLANLVAASPGGAGLALAVQGPCGRPLDCSRLESICLIAGGIGIAAVLPVLSTLRRPPRSGRRRRVHLLWSCRSLPLAVDLAAEVAGCLRAVAGPGGAAVVSCALHLTRAQSDTWTAEETKVLRQRLGLRSAEDLGGAGEEKGKGREGGEPCVTVAFGRPDLMVEIAKIRGVAGNDSDGDSNKGNNSGVLVCGPESLVADAEKAAVSHRLPLFLDSFLW